MASTFEPISEDGSVGYLTVPWSIGGIGRLITIDGQHRILDVQLEKKRITDEVSRIDRENHRANEAKKQPAGAAAPAQLAASRDGHCWIRSPRGGYQPYPPVGRRPHTLM
ncbi:hypothetical protein [Streptomyces sp. NPDC005209]|uniref:hypothetical protein n=1 Tax=Streptomyces sp. NPDC005209 TaxID=3156715 RepID=UPI0033A28A53